MGLQDFFFPDKANTTKTKKNAVFYDVGQTQWMKLSSQYLVLLRNSFKAWCTCWGNAQNSKHFCWKITDEFSSESDEEDSNFCFFTFFFIYFLFFFSLLALAKSEEIWGRKKGCWQIVDACAFHIGGMEIAVQRHSSAVQQKLWLWNLCLKISGKCLPPSEFHSGHLVPDSEAVHWLSVASKLHSVQEFSVLLTNLFILGLKFGELFVNLDCLLLIFCSLEIAVNILFSIRARNWGVAALRADKLGSSVEPAPPLSW